MPKKPTQFAFLIAIRQTDQTDLVYAILAWTVEEAIEVAAAQAPKGSALRHVGSLSAHTVKRIQLKSGEARII
ncbi:hypothetical protein FPV16_14750 [Methylobacterium sp. W2]|uniref:hypothetical protein n=1 Tax=Methylobacterium sp. W2 TaxID=2598107 RepID=UPI001D0C5ED1|nr:hypothetical protein [Methylobacterium sp. W2]MCC0807475.1 hypothetical protein [Methylobacterium sp. W2]